MENDEKKDMQVQENENEEENVDEQKLPFPRATITNLIRKNITQGKQIKGTVKDEMNLWVAELIEKIAGKMNAQPYTFVNYDMLKEAVSPYEDIKDINKQREELVEKISKLKNQCDDVINYIDTDTKGKAFQMNLEEELPFPKATITNKLRENLDEGKTIKGPVKKGLNMWLGRVVANISAKMDSYKYPYIDRSMFKDAIEPYEAISEIELEKERIVQQMESVKTSCDLLQMEVERKFKM
jgi:menaquinone-dependent protoporphyrinogen IX oxidase